MIKRGLCAGLALLGGWGVWADSASTERPGVTLIFAGDRAGRVEPCGCPQNPMGHIGRHVEHVNRARAAADDELYFDLGDLFFEGEAVADITRQQEARQAAVLARAVARMRLDFLVPGGRDLSAGYPGYLRLVRAAAAPVLAADWRRAQGGSVFPGHLIFERGGLNVGVIGIAGFDPKLEGVTVEPAAEVVAALLDSAGAEADLWVAATHLNAEEGRALAVTEPRLAAVLVADEHTHFFAKTPSGRVVVGSSKLGKHLARLRLEPSLTSGSNTWWGGLAERRAERALKQATGAKKEALSVALETNRAGHRYDYRLIALGEEKPSDSTVDAWVKSYVHFVGRLERDRGVAPPGYAGEGAFVGPEACAACHPSIVEHWKTTEHSHAYSSLSDRGQQYDRACIGCHTAGWRHPDGFSDPRAVGMLKNVSCESCHGPGKMHAQTGDKSLISRREANAAFCQTCHREDLETGFSEATHLPKIDHWSQ
jgi:hypothetical protein